MPAIARSEFTLALNQVATERGLDRNVILDSIKAAILAAYRKDHGTAEIDDLVVEIDVNSGEAKILKEGKNITPAGFGRIAAQTAKQVILQKIREAEKAAILSDYSERIGTITSGMILRFDGPNIIVDIGRTQAVMSPQEQIRMEKYHLNQRLTFYIADIRETHRGSEIIVSRSHKGLIEGLFKREVPEIGNGSVIIKEIAREAGARTKIAVTSTQSGVDPVGSCVGQKGVRVQTIISEIGGFERIDIIQWSENIKQFIAQALSPAKEVSAVLHEKEKTAEVYVSQDQLSLAIGKEGQNVRLAAKLTGYKINIKEAGSKESSTQEKKVEKKSEEKQSKGLKPKEKNKETKETKVKVKKAKKEIPPEADQPLAEKKDKEKKEIMEVKQEKALMNTAEKSTTVSKK